MKIRDFITNHGYEPQINWSTEIQIQNTAVEVYEHYMAGRFAKLSVRGSLLIAVMIHVV